MADKNKLKSALISEIENCNLLLERHRLSEANDLVELNQQYNEVIENIENRFEYIRNNKLRETIDSLQKGYNEMLEQAYREISSMSSITPLNDINELVGVLKNQNEDLKRENEIYADLANMGMAAEIVNHEFNQLLVNVEDGIRNIRNTNLNATQSFWIRQIEAGFRAIGTRHSQLSPMYRSYSLSRRKVVVFDLIDELIIFFNARLNQAGIKIENKVEKDFILMLSPSKIYPALSNLIDNSIYWLLNRQDKLIQIRNNPIKNSLIIEDSGPGISPRIEEKIFEPFFTRRSGGRGLGLSIVKKVLESQGHSISLIQTRQDKVLNGACFEIKFNETDRVG
ncbi:Globin-coupled histidine kinase [compost metagenome]